MELIEIDGYVTEDFDITSGEEGEELALVCFPQE